MEIQGNSFYKTDNTKYKATGKIILISIEIWLKNTDFIIYIVSITDLIHSC